MGESQSGRKVESTLPSLCLRLFRLFALVTVVALVACRPAAQKSKTLAGEQYPAPDLSQGLPRVSPAYVQWLTRQSMLGQSDDFINQVSGTSRIWQNSGTEDRFLTVLRACPNWLEINPHHKTAPHPVFKRLAAQTTLFRIRASGIQGIYISPTAEYGDLWAQQASADSDGEDVVSFTFSQAAGSEKDFHHFRQQMEDCDLQTGGSLPPAATGLGPDFMLQARGLPSFEGLYAAIEVPHEAWDLLPSCGDEWQVQSLSEKARAALVDRGLLPWDVRKSHIPWASPHGWAATGIVRGVDGKARRWIYCYDSDERRPVLFWQDPSGRARRLFAAASIRHTGLQQHTLAGLSLKALMGLEALREGEDVHTPLRQLEPGLSALNEISQAVHRYGGWSLVTDPLPLTLLPLLLDKADFVSDSLTPQALRHALRTGETRPLIDVLRQACALKIPQNRLARRINAWKYEDTGPGTAFSRDTAQTDKKRDASFSADNLLELALPIGLPGLVFLSEDEVSRVLSSTLTEAPHQKSTNPLVARHALRLAEGEFMPPLPAPKGCVLLASKLPGGGFWITAANFSKKTQEVPLSLPNRPGTESTVISCAPHAGLMTKSDSTDILSLAPFTFCYVSFGKKIHLAESVTSPPKDTQSHSHRKTKGSHKGTY